MKKIYYTCIGWIAAAVCVEAQVTFPRNGAYDERPARYAFTNATIVADPATILHKATLLIENGVISDIGTHVSVPKGTVVTDLQGKFIYPSFIDIYTDYGMSVASRVPAGGARLTPQLTSDKKGLFGWNQSVNAEHRAAAMFVPEEHRAESFRRAGFGTVLTHFRDGIIRGTGLLVTLDTRAPAKSVINAEATAHYSFSKGSSPQQYPNSPMGAVALLRQTFYDADWYARGGDKKETNLSLAALNRIRNLPSVFESSNKWALIRADRFGDEFGIQYIIKGSGDEYQRVEEIRKTKAPLIIPLNFPEAYDVTDAWDADVVTLAELKHWELAPSNPAVLARAGIPFAITSDGLKSPVDILGQLRKAVDYGLSKEKALEALTRDPARILKADHVLGSLKKGFVANFLVASGDIFEKESVILQNWVQGYPYVIRKQTPYDIRGVYDLTVGNEKGRLEISGTLAVPKFELRTDTVNIIPKAALENELVTLSYRPDRRQPATHRLTGWFTGPEISGHGTLADGTEIRWHAKKIPPDSSAASKADFENRAEAEDSTDKGLGPVLYPFTGLGLQKRPASETVLIRNATIWTCEEAGVLKETDVLLRDGKIAGIGKSLPLPGGGRVIDGTGKHLTPGIVDEHSHIALFGVNEGSQSSSAEVRMSDVINPDDVNIYRQLAGGVTTSQLLHGSANAIGGQSAVIKLKWGAAPDELWIPEARFIKFALGENVKQSNWGDVQRVRYPQTRMGVEQVYYDHFIRAREYAAEWKKYHSLRSKTGIIPPRRDIELDALAEILDDRRFITCHSYVQSEINMLMSVADSLKFRIHTFTHILEGYKVADKMAGRKIGGSTFSDWWAYKMEVKEAIPYNAALMAKEGVLVSINSDDAEMARRLNQEAAKTVAFGGMSEEEALKMITLNPARMLRLDHRIGSIRKGKDADVVLWNEHPLSVYASPDYTFIEGAVYFSKEDDGRRREELNREKARLVQKSLAAKAGGALTRPPQSTRPRMWHCEDILGEHAEHEAGH